ncbi:hypothetical protein CC78DRAFT_559561 [Lojkania enalia]|uniref:Rhodopsin domain-containing protein n=1 Tax=Lojkania enalia TaxID=147567 RepID=A0A9P4KEB4_9PLEO|nr:hypothetical protein CC78DRAFT_559561 [Didymosphaeria enalia]
MATAVPNPDLIPAIPSSTAQQRARSFAGAAIALNIVAFGVFSGRMWTRSFPAFRLGPDDYFIAVAYVLVLTDSILLLKTVPFVFGSDPNKVTLADAIHSNYLAVVAQPIWAWSMACIKISVALMLLRLETEKLWRRLLWANIVVQLLLGTYNTLSQLLQCIPLKGAWDLLGVVDAKCWSKTAIRDNLICISVVNIITDFIFALIPISFLRKVQRPLRERVIIGILMALGLFAGAASIVKLVKALQFGRTDDPTLEGIEIGMWSCIEEQVGFIAACVPCLRSPFQRVLEYFGLVSTHDKSSYGHNYGQMYGSKHARSRKSAFGVSQSRIRMKSLRSPSADAHSEENILASSGAVAKNGEIWCTTELRLEDEEVNKPEGSSIKLDGA